MKSRFPITLAQFAWTVAALLIFNVLWVTVLNYPDYLQPNFRADFLLGREVYFWQGYHVWFYIHIFSSPLSLGLGLLLISDRLRRWAPLWHRRLGKVQIANVLLLVVPSGIGMSFWAASGWPAGVALGALGVVSAVCAWCGWRAAVRRNFANHRRWMWRLFVLLGSAVTIRALGGLTEVLQIEATSVAVANAWICWIVPLAICEVVLRNRLHPKV